MTQPYCCGVGGDIFVLYYEAATRRVHFLNGAGRSGSFVNRVLATTPFTFIGKVSYSFYLWHWPVIILLLSVMPGDSWPYYVLALVLSFALSMLSYHCVENPPHTVTSRERLNE